MAAKRGKSAGASASAKKKPKAKAKKELPSSVTYHHLKSAYYRVVHVDGAWGGPTPSRLVHISMYSERHSIPKSVEHDLSPEGVLGDEIAREQRSGAVRELEVGLMMAPDVALSVGLWLIERAIETGADPQRLENTRFQVDVSR